VHLLVVFSFDTKMHGEIKVKITLPFIYFLQLAQKICNVYVQPPQGTALYHSHLQCQVGRFVSSSEVESYAGWATQARQVPIKEPNKVCPTTGQEGLFT
jgi:hypothetical protein